MIADLLENAAHLVRTITAMPIRITALEHTMTAQIDDLKSAIVSEIQSARDETLAAFETEIAAIRAERDAALAQAHTADERAAALQAESDAKDAAIAKLTTDLRADGIYAGDQPEQPVEPETPVEQPAPADGQPVEQDETGTVTEPTA